MKRQTTHPGEPEPEDWQVDEDKFDQLTTQVEDEWTDKMKPLLDQMGWHIPEEDQP